MYVKGSFHPLQKRAMQELAPHIEGVCSYQCYDFKQGILIEHYIYRDEKRNVIPILIEYSLTVGNYTIYRLMHRQTKLEL